MSASDLPRSRLFGLDFLSDTTIPQLVAVLTEPEHVAPGSWALLVTPNVDHVVRYSKIPTEREVGEQATWLLPDGMPIVWASKLLGAPLAGRLTGSDLFSALWQRLCELGEPIVCVVANDTVGSLLQSEHPAAQCIVAPVFDTHDDDAIAKIVDEVVARVEHSHARLVMIGVSMPKHHRLGAALARRPAPPGGATILLLGASAEFHVGVRARAPRWMQRLGIEWMHRLAVDPRGMAKRYLVDDMVFFRLVWSEWRQSQRERRRSVSDTDYSSK